MSRRHRSVRPVFGATLVLLLAACDRSGNQTNDAVGGVGTGGTTEQVVAGGTVAPAMIEVDEITLGRTIDQQNEITDETSEFRSGDAVIAVVKTENAPAGASLVGRWTFDDGQVVAEQTERVPAGEEARTVFRLPQGRAWAEGDYTLVVLHEGREVERKDFKIQ